MLGSGGPQKHTGLSMTEGHRHLMIAGNEWKAFMDDLHQTLDAFGVPAREQQVVTAVVESTRKDIVVQQPQAAQ